MTGRVEVFVNQEDMALINCPHCGSMKHVSVAKFKNRKHSLQVRCACNRSFHVDLNFRRRHRKQTDLAGCFIPAAAGGENGMSEEQSVPNCRIVNLSLGGLGFRHETAETLAVGEELMIDFTLDDRKQSRLVQKVVVRHVGDGGYVGAEFCSGNQHLYEKILGLYLMS